MKHLYRLFSTSSLIAFFLLSNTANAQYFTMADDSAKVCVGYLFDTGDSLGDYSNDEDDTLHIVVPGSSIITLTFDSASIQSPDYIAIYDGPSTGSPVLLANTNSPSGTYMSTGQELTVVFHSNGSNTNYGFALHWTANFTPNIAIVDPGAVCSGASVAISSTVMEAGASPVYAWFVNSVQVSTNDSLITSTLANGDSIWAVVYTNNDASCYNDTMDTSNVVIASVTPTVAPSLAISVSANPVCSADSSVFTVTDSTNAGDADFAWTLNGTPVGSNSFQYLLNSPTNNDKVKVVMTPEPGGCYTVSTVSDSITLTVNPTLTASVSLAASSTSICNGDSVGFTATPTNGGGSPVYAWTINGTPAGTNSPNFFSLTLNNNDEVRVTMASSIATGCLIDSLSADSVTIGVTANTTASVSVVKDVVNVCSTDSVNFTATPTNGGGTPVYTWTLNGTPVGTNSPNYYNTALTNNDKVKVTMASSFAGGCLIDSISADSIIVPVTTTQTASVSVAGDHSICDGDNVNFVATPTNGGGSPVYSWTLNGGPVGTNSATYSNASLSDGDEVQVTLASSISSGCVIDSISVDSIIMNVNPLPSASISGSVNVACYGDSTATATAMGTGGTEAGTYDFLWSDGQTTAMATGLHVGTYSVTVTDDSTCFDTVSVVITQPAGPLTVGFSVTDVTTFGGNNGSITATPSGGTPGYSQKWENGVTSATISGLASGWYTDTISDLNSCRYVDSAFVDQPSLLLGGEIRIGGATSASICDEDTVGAMTEAAAVVGGIGTKTYTWQYSFNLLKWYSYPASNTTNYTLNDSITKITFVRRRVVDQVSDSAFSNVLFLNYVPDVLINIIGLDPTYCNNDAPDVLFGSPAGPGTGTFVNSAWMNAGTKTFTPSAAVGGGAYNVITYNYTSPEGCFSSGKDSTIVNSANTGIIGIGQTIYNKSDPVDTLTSTYPSTGVFSGVGVYKAGGIWQFNPALVDSSLYDSTLNITFEYTNGFGCVSRDTLQVMVIDNVFQLTTNLSNTTEFNTCYDNVTDTIYAKIPANDTVTQFIWIIWKEGQYNVLPAIAPTPFYTTGSYTGTLKFHIDPDSLTPVSFGPDYSLGGPTPLGVSRVIVEFRYVSAKSGFVTSLTKNLEIINLGQAKISPDQLNSNGTLSLPFQYCESVDSASFTTSFLSIIPRTTTKTFSISPTDPDHLHDNTDGTATFYPNKSPLGTKTFTFTYTDNATGCSIDTVYSLKVDPLPVVSLNNVSSQYCSNEGVISIWGSPYATNKGTFDSPTKTSLGLTHINGDSTATFLAGPSAVGQNQEISYVFTHPVTGCVNADTAMFDVDTIPRLRLLSNNGYSFCVSNTANNPIEGQVFNTTSSIFVNLIGDSITGPGIVNRNDPQGRADFRASLAGVGSHTIRFHFTNKTTFCYNYIDTVIVVNALPNASFTSNDYNVCMTSADVANFTYTGGQTGTSVYSIAGGVNNPITQFRPVINSDIKFGPNQVVNTFTNTLTTCVNTDTITITVDTFPIVSITSTPGAYCYNGGTFTFEGTPTSPGSVVPNVPSYFYSATLGFTQTKTGVGQYQGSYSPDSSNIGLHLISYNYTDPTTGCFNGDTMQIEIYDIPHLKLFQADSTNHLEHCLGFTNTYQKIKNGVPDPDPMSYLIGPGFLDSTSTVFNPDSAGVGFHTVTYKTTDPNGCYNEIDSTIEVLATSDASFSLSDSVACIDPKDSILLTATYFSASSSQFNFYGTTKQGSNPAVFYLDSASIGPNVVSYTYDDGNGCTATKYDTIMVNDTPSVAFTQIDPKYCFNGGTRTLKASPASLGSSYFSSPTPGLINNSPLSAGKDSVQFTLDSLFLGNHTIRYTHVDANGCETVLPKTINVQDIPRLSVSFIDSVNGNPTSGDGKVCAMIDRVTLNGVTTANATSPKLGGYFTGSLYGVLNNIVTTDTNSLAEYGPVPDNMRFKDTIYYHYQDTAAYGCYNRIARVLDVRSLPPAGFTINNSGNPSAVNICPDQTGMLSAYWDTLDIGEQYPEWPLITGLLPNKLDRKWFVNGVAAKVAGQFNPGTTGSDDQTIYNGWNVIKQEFTDRSVSPNCVVSYEDSIYLDSFPVLDIHVDPLYCSNLGVVEFSASPPSPGTLGAFHNASRFTSTNLNINGGLLDSSLTSMGDSTIKLAVGGITPAPGINSHSTLNMSYEYIEPTTNCKTKHTETFELRLPPVLEMISDTSFCPYENPFNITLRVNGGPNMFIAGDSITGLGLTGGVQPGGTISYNPHLFLGNLNPTHDLIFFQYTDTSGCIDTLTKNITVKNQPQLSIAIPRDSVCLEGPAQDIIVTHPKVGGAGTYEYGTSSTSLSGPFPASGDKNYFLFDGLNPSQGATSRTFVPATDSKGDKDGVRTPIVFIGTYEQTGTCPDTIMDTIVTHPKPIAKMYLDGVCEKYLPVLHGDSSIIDTANFSPSDYIQSYFWQIDDSSSTDKNPADSLSVTYTHWKKLNKGPHDLYLTVKSIKGCLSDQINVKKTYVESPKAVFEWDMGDECDGETVEFRSTTTNPNVDPLVYFWDFGDGNTLGPNTADDTVNHNFSNVRKYSVMLEVSQGTDCRDTSIQDIYIRPIITEYPYLDNFENGYTGWVAWALDSDTSLGGPSYFTKGKRTLGNLVGAASGDSTWYIFGYQKTIDTLTYQLYNNDVKTSVVSPCFDMNNTERPMVTLNTIYNVETNDGAVLQYTTDRNTTLAKATWKNVGDFLTVGNTHYNTGINWYTKQNIFGSPGSQTDKQGKIGWTDSSTVDHDSIIWVQARHDLDSVLNQPYVRFRVAFGSGGEIWGEGFAFDDFGIRERKKNVVYELFTNARQASVFGPQQEYDEDVIPNSTDVLDIQYHTAYPNADGLNLDNTADPSARSLFYGVTEVPFLRMDGTKYANFINNKSFGTFTFKPRALEDPKFRVELTFDGGTNVLNTNVVATDKSFNTAPVDVTVHVALVEKEIDGTVLATNERDNLFADYKYRNTLKRLYPNAGGTTVLGMIDGDSHSFNTTIQYDNFYGDHNAQYKVIVFVQDRKTKEIYQADYVDMDHISTGGSEYEKIVAGALDYNLYPNPTTDLTYMDFNAPLDHNYQLAIFNQMGQQVAFEILPAGTKLHSFDMSTLKAGMYFITLNDGEHKVAIHKLMVTH